MMTHPDFYESFEQMAAGLAHEVRNPLSLVRANIELLESSETSEEPCRRYRLMRRELDRANAALSELMLLARPADAAEPQCALSLNRLLYGLIDTMKMTYGDLAAFTLTSAAGDYAVSANEEKLCRVFGNLLRNALESIAEARPVGGGVIHLSLSAADAFVTVAVHDNGRGMTSPESASAALPFFTTKANGNGLGLHLSRMIVRSYGGTLTLEGVDGMGCTAIVRLPLA